MESDGKTRFLSKVQGAWAEGGASLVGARTIGRAQRYRRELRRKLKPTALELMLDSPWSVLRSASDVVRLLHANGRWPQVTIGEIESVLNEGGETFQNAVSQSSPDARRPEAFTPIFDVEPEAALLLYAICRLDKPNHVLETGVARGMSTAMILAALRENELGQLTSIDVTDQVGSLVAESLRERWSLVVVSTDAPLRELELALVDAPPIEMYLHDSDHRPEYQYLEYSLVKQYSNEDAVLFSDDVEASDVFTDVFRSRRCIALTGERKCLGLAVDLKNS